MSRCLLCGPGWAGAGNGASGTGSSVQRRVSLHVALLRGSIRGQLATHLQHPPVQVQLGSSTHRHNRAVA